MVIRGKGKSDTLFLIEGVYKSWKLWIYQSQNLNLFCPQYSLRRMLSQTTEWCWRTVLPPIRGKRFCFFFLFCWIYYVTSSSSCTSLQFTTGYLGRKGKVLGFLFIHSKIELKSLCELKTTVWISAASIENLILSLLISYLWGDIFLWRMETSVR